MKRLWLAAALLAAMNVHATGDVGNCSEIEDEAQRTACFTVWYQARQEQAEVERETADKLRRIEERQRRNNECLERAARAGLDWRRLGCY